MSANLRRYAVVFCTALALVFGGFLASDSEATADTIAACGTTVDERSVVISVHGFNGDPEVWEAKGSARSMNDSIEMVDGVVLAAGFNYQPYNTKWVTDPNIGKALAVQIKCLSAASLRAGGDGRVIVIAHSMGGLAVREAMKYLDPKIVGLVITIGTPHQGAPIAKWCNPTGCGWIAPAVAAMRPGSPQLRQLPLMPRTVPLRAIAGDVVQTLYLWGRKVGEIHYGDRIVSVGSATAQYTTAYPGDGRFVIKCAPTKTFRGIPLEASCDHGSQLRDAAVQANVRQALDEYVGSLPTAPSPTPTSGCSSSPVVTPSEPEGADGGMGTVPSSEPACS
jgi:pimeloyl-ACP methyl ester carboxylesterase